LRGLGHEARFGFTIGANQGNDEHAANRNYPLQLDDRNERRDERPHTRSPEITDLQEKPKPHNPRSQNPDTETNQASKEVTKFGYKLCT